MRRVRGNSVQAITSAFVRGSESFARSRDLKGMTAKCDISGDNLDTIHTGSGSPILMAAWLSSSAGETRPCCSVASVCLSVSTMMVEQTWGTVESGRWRLQIASLPLAWCVTASSSNALLECCMYPYYKWRRM